MRTFSWATARAGARRSTTKARPTWASSGRILDGLPTTDMAPNWEVTLGRRGLLVPDTLFIAYTSEGGPLKLFGDEIPPNYRVVDPRTGDVLREGVLDPAWAPDGKPNTSPGAWIPDEGEGPRVYICY